MPELIPAEPGTPAWYAARRLGVTATDIVTILGLGAKSAYSLFWNKMGQVPDDPDNDRFRLGRELEPYVVARWLEEHPVMHPHFMSSGSGLFRHSERAWQLATPDRVLGRTDRTAFTSVFEGKSWADADRHAWDDGLPARVRAQVLWQMDVMDAAKGHVGVVFLPSGEFRSYVIEHIRCRPGASAVADGNCDLCADLGLMRAAGEEFMGQLRLELPPPDPDASAATLAAVRARFAKAPDKEAEVSFGLWNAWELWKDRKAEAEAKLREAEIYLREEIGEASVLTRDGQPVARRIVSDAQVKAHTRHQDYLRRITPRGDDDDQH